VPPEERTAGLLPRRDWRKPRLAGSRSAARLPSRGLAWRAPLVSTCSVDLIFFLQKAFVWWGLTSPSCLCSLLLTATDSGLSQVEGLLQGTGIQALPVHVLEWLIVKAQALEVHLSVARLEGLVFKGSSFCGSS